MWILQNNVRQDVETISMALRRIAGMHLIVRKREAWTDDHEVLRSAQDEWCICAVRARDVLCYSDRMLAAMKTGHVVAVDLLEALFWECRYSRSWILSCAHSDCPFHEAWWIIGGAIILGRRCQRLSVSKCSCLLDSMAWADHHIMLMLVSSVVRSRGLCPRDGHTSS